MYNEPYVSGDDLELERRTNITFDKQRVYRDNWNIGRRDIQLCRIGDLWKPWYYFKDLGNGQTSTPFDTNAISLVYNITEGVFNTRDIFHTCFQSYHRGKDKYQFFRPGLLESLQEDGQKTHVDCVIHYSKNTPNKVKFNDGSGTDDLRIFEGHGRCVCLEELGLPIKARVYHLYDMEEPIDIEKHYNSIYDNTFWSPYQDAQSKQPWFTLGHFNDLTTTHKYQSLKKCFEFIKKKNIPVSVGIDIGCGEGAYTLLANKELNIPVAGIDSEGGQILRGLLAKMYVNANDIDFRIKNWYTDKVPYENFDFCMMLSILHHHTNPREFLKQAMQNKKCAIVEARIKQGHQQIIGSIVGFQTKEDIINSLKDTGMQFEHITTQDGDRNFFVLWK